ncbi:WD40-repeat-containing domain protein [Boletus reticuloceps]|uniref:WD40-repeat-containing domain protein n=1 Tax=Boletus reticuloceps TaxID=495285 RepID=A0A8I2YGK4_9AGAM|nr:WD40-repeat-containing domain protein [Boletus reticuloceps]
MGKQSRKRQKTSKEDVQPLGSSTVVDDADKDDEERQLESMLFGVPYVPSQKSDGKRRADDADVVVISDVEDGATERHLKELENMLDSDLFFIDDGAGSSSIKAPALDEGASEHDENESGADIAIEEEPLPHEPETVDDTAITESDPDDSNIQVSLTSHTRLRKLRDAPAEDTVGGREYERRLRRQYEQINPTPEWATKARKKSHPKRQRSTSGSEPEVEVDVEDIIPDLLASTGGISGGKKPKTLSPGIISVDRLRDANQAAPAEGEIKSLQFHPSPQIPILLTASTDRRLRLFHVDGLTNPHAQTLHIPSLPLTNAMFHPSGSSILLTGPRPFYYTYDLQSGTSHLWTSCAFNPTGDVLAIAGRRGHIHLVDWRSGAAQVVAGLKANAGIRSLWWSRSDRSGPGALLSLTEDAQVYVWDVGQRKCVKRWQDEGGFGSRLMGGDQGGKYLAIGSNIGLVNMYSADSALSLDVPKLKPLKTLGNLTTNISCLSYNHDAQLLAMASSVKKDQMRLVHLPSLTVFGNWPTTSTPLGHVTAMDFSTGSEYLAIGNNRGRVLLYQLRDYTGQ